MTYPQIAKADTVVEPDTMMIILPIRRHCNTNHHHTLSTDVTVNAVVIHITVALWTESSILRRKRLRFRMTRLVVLQI